MSATAERCELSTTIQRNEIAEQVGYGSAFSLSTAFKRARGISSQQYRDQS